jgi:hypothetical protein
MLRRCHLKASGSCQIQKTKTKKGRASSAPGGPSAADSKKTSARWVLRARASRGPTPPSQRPSSHHERRTSSCTRHGSGTDSGQDRDREGEETGWPAGSERFAGLRKKSGAREAKERQHGRCRRSRTRCTNKSLVIESVETVAGVSLSFFQLACSLLRTAALVCSVCPLLNRRQPRHRLSHRAPSGTSTSELDGAAWST